VAAGALRALGLPGATPAVRTLAAGELALGAACLLHPTRALAVALAVAYTTFALVAVILRRRRVTCGCFGEDDLPVSLVHVIASELLGALAAAAAVASPGGLAWLASQPALSGAVMGVAIAGATYATLLVYTQLPMAWNAWSGE
jgi:hypothetical protein